MVTQGPVGSKEKFASPGGWPWPDHKDAIDSFHCVPRALAIRVDMATTTQIGYEVEEVVLKLWLTKYFGPQFNSRGATVWTYSVSPTTVSNARHMHELTSRQSELRESTSWWIVTGPRLISKVRPHSTRNHTCTRTRLNSFSGRTSSTE